MQEKELFSSLIRELPEKTYGRLENSVLPNKLISDKYRAYYNDPYSLWFIRVPVSENEVYYYFGFDVYRDPLSPGLIFRFNTDGEESDIKFLDDALTVHVAVEGNDPEIKSHLSRHFWLCHNPEEEDDLYHIYIRDNDNPNPAQNIEKLISTVEFDCDLDNVYPVVRKTVSEFITEPKPSDDIERYLPLKNPEELQTEAISEIAEAIDDGYEFIILETGIGLNRLEIAAALADSYNDSCILLATEQLQKQYLKDFAKYKNASVLISHYRNFFKLDRDNQKLLIMDDAHVIENRIVSFLKNEFGKEPVDIDDYAKRYLLDKAEICIFMSSSILDWRMFASEFAVDFSRVKYIHKDLFSESKSRIHTRNAVNMKYEFVDDNKHLTIPIIRNILDEHPDEKGLIVTNYSFLVDYVFLETGSDRLLMLSHNHRQNLKKFKESSDNVLVVSSIEDIRNLNQESFGFQIVVRISYPSLDERAQRKDEVYQNWYAYRLDVSIVRMLNKLMEMSENGDIYMVDERFLYSVIRDIEGDNFIPSYITDSIVDADLTDCGFVSDNIKKKYGVYYLYDYIPDTRQLPNYDFKTKKMSSRIKNYKDYQHGSPLYCNDFKFFTEKLMEGICEFSNQILDGETQRIVLVSIPSSTVERDRYSTVKSSIDYIEREYRHGSFKSGKEIVNGNDVLTRVKDVRTAHLNKNRTYYIEHLNSIRCDLNMIPDLDSAAFIILDDITTRGTIMNACEDILIENGVNRQNIYKFAISKTIGDNYEQV